MAEVLDLCLEINKRVKLIQAMVAITMAVLLFAFVLAMLGQ